MFLSREQIWPVLEVESRVKGLAGVGVRRRTQLAARIWVSLQGLQCLGQGGCSEEGEKGPMQDTSLSSFIIGVAEVSRRKIC